MEENELWGWIRREARQDPALQDILEQAEIYYKLKYER